MNIDIRKCGRRVVDNIFLFFAINKCGRRRVVNDFISIFAPSTRTAFLQVRYYSSTSHGGTYSSLLELTFRRAD